MAMFIALGWILTVIVVAAVGSEKECGFFMTLIVSIFLTPLFGMFYVLSSRDLKEIKHQKTIESLLNSLTHTLIDIKDLETKKATGTQNVNE
jgi:hypothetical protein